MEFLRTHIKENSNNDEEVQITLRQISKLFSIFEIKQHYKRDINEYCQLLIHLLTVEIADKKQFFHFLNDSNVFEKSLIECDEFREVFLDKILTILIETSAKYENDAKIINLISNLVKKCIFDKNMQSFDCYLNRHPTDTCTDEHKICAKVFKFLQKTYSKETASYGFQIVYQSFFTSFEDNFNLNYKMLIMIFNLIGFNVKEHYKLNNSTKVATSKLDINRTLEITNQLFHCLPNLKVDNDHKIDDITMNDFIINILKSIISLTQHPDNCCYDIIMNIIEFNPLIIVSIIDEIIVYIIVTDNCGIIERYCQVFVKLIELFSKLHRINHFISRLIRVLKINYNGRNMNETIYKFNNITIQMKPICCDIDQVLPKIVLNAFTNCIISNIISRQMINILKTMVFHFNEMVDEMQANHNVPLIYIEFVATLLCNFFNSVRVAEHTTISSVIQKFHDSLNEMAAILNKFARILLRQPHNHTLMATFLNVCHNWGEINMILAYYCPNDVTLTKINVNDNTACNITYLHHYLTKEQWCLIAERLMNFGERTCKGMMHKLMIQKLRAMTIFDDINDDIIAPIIKELYSTFDHDIIDITTTKFVVKQVINKVSPTVIIELCDIILNDLLNCNNSDLLNQSHIYDNHLIIIGLLWNIFMKINKLLKQKRRHDDQILKKSLLTKIMKTLTNDDLFLNQDFNRITPSILQCFNGHSEQILDININEPQLLVVMNVLRHLPVVLCDEHVKKIVFILLLAFYNDLYSSNCSDDVKTICETVIIGVAKSCKSPIVEIGSIDLLQIIIKKFDRFDQLYGYLVNRIFKNHQSIPEFQTGIDYLSENLDDDRHFKCSLIILNVMNKVQRKKIDDNIRSTLNQQESIIYRKLFKIIQKHEITNKLIEPYALTLKHFIQNNNNNNEKLIILKARLDEILEYTFNNLNNNNNLNSCILLLTTIINNKLTLDFGEESILKIWNQLKIVELNDDNFNDYSQFILLIMEQMPDGKYSQILNDFFEFTSHLIDCGDSNEIMKCMNTWTILISCKCNLKKTSTFQVEFEKLLHRLIEMVKTIDYKEDVFDGITKPFITAIQTNLLCLTSDIMDSFFVYTTVLITISKQSNCTHLFNLSISIIENLFVHRNALIMDRLSVCLLQYRLLLKHLCIYSDSNVNYQQDFVDQLSNCALNLEKLTRTLVSHPKDMARIAPYLISDILAQYELRPIHKQIKLHLNNCLYALMALCDQHAVKCLMAFLSNASTAIFKLTYNHYKKYYQYKGKV